MKNVIYYFSGTGNSLAAAKAIAGAVGDCEMIDIAKSPEPIAGTAERIGFVFPLYFWGLPAIVHSFLRNLKIEGSPYLFSVITAGGDSASVGNIQVRKILKKSGLALAAGFRVTMPDNYFVFYDADARPKAAEALEKAKVIIDQIARQVENKTGTGIEGPAHWYEKALAPPVNALFRKNVHGAGRHFRASSECTGCGKCVRACGVGNVRMSGKRPVWGTACEQCYGCINACPAQAISYKTDKKVISQYLHPDYAKSGK